MAIRAEIERILDPENFSLPDVARSIAAGKLVSGEGGHPLPDLSVEEIQATLCEFVFAFRTALLELADQIESSR